MSLQTSRNKRCRCTKENDTDFPKLIASSSVGGCVERPLINAIIDIPDIFKQRGWHLRNQSSGIRRTQKALKLNKLQRPYGTSAQWGKTQILNSLINIPEKFKKFRNIRPMASAFNYFDKGLKHQRLHGYDRLKMKEEKLKVDNENKMDNSVAHNVKEVIGSQVKTCSIQSQEFPVEKVTGITSHMLRDIKNDINSEYTVIKIFKSEEEKNYNCLLQTLPKSSEFRNFTSSKPIIVKSNAETTFDFTSNQSKTDITSKIVADVKAKLEQQRKFIMGIGHTFKKIKDVKEKCQSLAETVKNFSLKYDELEKSKELMKEEKQEEEIKFDGQIKKQENLKAKELVQNVSLRFAAHKEIPAYSFEFPNNFIFDPLNIGISEDDHHRFMFWTEVKYEKWASKFSEAIPEYPLQLREIKTLGRGELVMGDVINAYLSLLKKRSQSNPALPSCNFLSSYFFISLQRRKNKAHHNFRKQDLFSASITLVPFNVNYNHWTLFAIFNEEEDKKILYFDSLPHGEVHPIVNDLECFFQEEAELKKKLFYPKYKKLSAVCPQQNNYTDCGIFLMTNAEFISRNLQPSFNQDQIYDYRVKILTELFMGNLLT